MSKASLNDVSDCITTQVYHSGDEVAVRARSKHSRTAHEPVADANGDVVFFAPTTDEEPGPVKIVDESHPHAEPRPKCGLPTGDVDGVDFRLTLTSNVANRPTCSYCDGTNGDPSKGSANKSFARRMRYGESWGDD